MSRRDPWTRLNRVRGCSRRKSRSRPGAGEQAQQVQEAQHHVTGIGVDLLADLSDAVVEDVDGAFGGVGEETAHPVRRMPRPSGTVVGLRLAR